MNAIPLPDTQTRLLLTAERLFAQEGIDAVSARRIAQEAGQRNISATTYHFGSKEQLIDALLSLRMQAINARREQLLDALGPAPTLHDWLETIIAPLVEQLADPNSHFVGCIEQIYSRVRGVRLYATLSADLTTGLERANSGLLALLEQLPKKLREVRLQLMASQIMHSAADWYYRRERGETLLPLDELIAALVDFTAAGLLAPLSSRGSQGAWRQATDDLDAEERITAGRGTTETIAVSAQSKAVSAKLKKTARSKSA